MFVCSRCVCEFLVNDAHTAQYKEGWSLSNYYIILLSVLSLYIRYRKWDWEIQVAEDDILTRLLTHLW